MEMTLEVIVGIIALVVGLPPSIFVVWRCMSRRRSRDREPLPDGRQYRAAPLEFRSMTWSTTTQTYGAVTEVHLGAGEGVLPRSIDDAQAWPNVTARSGRIVEGDRRCQLIAHPLRLERSKTSFTTSSPPRSQTPPRQPLHGVRITAAGLKKVMKAVYPYCTTISVAQLPSGRSFNNRIYHIKIDRGQLGVEDLVFKLAGRFFKSDKIQNEVACLRLKEIHCPEVPAPRVRAWPEDGRTLVKISSDGDGCETIGAPESEKGDHNGGWILMTRVYGKPVMLEDWDQQTMRTLAHELADMVATWRRKIPSIRHSANPLFCEQDTADLSLSVSSNKDPAFPWTKAQGLIGAPVDATPRAKQPASLVEYYQMRLESALYEVETKGVYALNRHLCVIVRRFATETLPRLSLSSGPPNEKAFVFTHCDLSTRNTLVDGNPPIITGVVDFEFSGFFPETEEFVNAFDDDPGDWPKGFTAAYREELEVRGVATPLKSIDQDAWAQVLSLDRLVEHIAPWCLAGQESEEVLRDELEKADEVVRQELVALEKSLDQ